MSKFYVTFGGGSPRRNQFFVIEAEGRMAAQEQAFRVFGQDWAMIYDADEFDGQAEQFGLMEVKH